LLQLLVVFLDGTAIHLRQQKNLLPVTITQGLPHADFRYSIVVVPAVVQEDNSTIDSSIDKTNTLNGVLLFAQVVMEITARFG
jgi:hypothetical protein